MSRTNEARYTEWHETCKYKSRLDASVCSKKQRWNDDKRRCECKELIDNGVCDKEFIWNPSNWKCEWDKSCDIGEYLDDEICLCRKKLVDKLLAECTENIEETRIVENKHKNKCSSFALCIVLFSIFLLLTLELLLILFICIGT